MGSTGEPDRKRRHLSSISPTATSAKKQPLLPLSEDKKLDTAVLQYQNQKLVQKLEAQKVEHTALENKFCQLKEKQQPYDETLEAVNEAWEQMVNGLESCSICTKDSMSSERDANTRFITEDGSVCSLKDAFLSRLLETGATESSSAINSLNHEEEFAQTAADQSKSIVCNIVAAIDDLWYLKDGLQATILKALLEDGSCRQKVSTELQTKVRNLRVALGDLHLKHKSLATELQCHQDTDAKNKAELRRLRVELESTVAELEESNCKLATLKTESDAAKGAFFPVLNFANKPVASDRTKDKQKELQDMESTLKELLDQASCQLLELKRLHEDRIGILKQLSDMQNTLKNVNAISSSPAYVLARDQLAKSKADLVHYHALFEKLQVEKDNLAWREREMDMKNDLLDVFHRNSVLTDSRITGLRTEIQKQISVKNMIETRLEEASREPGRKEIIAEFKALVSSFPEDMGSMQSQLSTYKEAASDIHSLRADVQSLKTVLHRKAKELETLSARSVDQVAELGKLQTVVCDLEESDMELKLILEMYRRESTDSRDVLEARDSEYKAWAYVQSLKSSLDEHSLELRVKTSIEAEAISQQRLAAAEAEIADLRQRLEASKREKSSFSVTLTSKNEENESYLSEIETIGQAYDDMQTQNQQLMQQITERDDYNIKLVLEGVQARQLRDALLADKKTMEKALQQAKESVDFYDMKAARIEDQFKMCSDQVQKLSEDRLQSLATLGNSEKKLLDVRKSSQQLKESLDRSQSKVEKGRVTLAELQIGLENERFDKKRLEEELEVARRKVSHLRTQMEGSMVGKLQQELREYREILKCSICLDRPKEVVLTKCYHLFCNACVQRILGMRHRKCPVCAASFGANDVKPVYI
ncbi:E3 ubiquitin-protein ligase BRE1-like 1 [Rhododendron vialii]|uniref:E3 ubiquitin-protein ligase BRE1-like 1 n=1 Tax=Rhododendron vialii TaxID=182163 RepID=UPI00265DA0C6|nr:E3 ubiquitin-protein ligase BRE1-like 1 [Rhododendron vialii]